MILNIIGADKVISKCFGPVLQYVKQLNYSSVKTPSLREIRKNLKFEDKVAVVTGGGSGIGYEIAKQFLKGGMTCLTIVDTNKPKSLENIEKLTNEFGEDNVLYVEADVADAEQMDYAFRSTVLHYHAIDLIVNNAGVMNDVQWETELRTNLHGCVIGTLLGMQYMSKSSSGKGGTIINIGSIMSMIPSCGFPIYTMTQFGIAGFSKALGSSYLYDRTGVKVFGYCPGLTDTRLMKDAPNNSINQNFAAEFQEEIDGCVIQSPEMVAEGLIKILENAKPGSVWIAENNTDPYEINFPVAEGVKQKSRADAR
ncbi:hypothetical protein NQ315_008178 [Exocentrus adspersus]|uniref:15-hydroxyprostaglandin dehydrogenase [NAD(+)]-like n=1 Tax=Exocentrus adspersus TaxID=1586481 RepID=A0AAV8VVR1_9CUCU|nr:hypothetical protein NQ315_008178 [Exocentrus adspersus]